MVQHRADLPDTGYMSDEQLVSITKAAQLVGVSRRTIYNWMSAGKLQIRRTAGGRVRITASSLWRPASSPASAAAENPAA